jgi:hypothetical protein
VAHATGETRDTISRLGFSIADPLVVHHDPEACQRAPLVVDWDELDARRRSVPR